MGDGLRIFVGGAGVYLGCEPRVLSFGQYGCYHRRRCFFAFFVVRGNWENICILLASAVFQFIEKNGWEAFRAEEERALKYMLSDTEYAQGHVIACGGGIVETGRLAWSGRLSVGSGF